jgi:uncharacterized membrane protein YhaH (DUF805 family)
MRGALVRLAYAFYPQRRSTRAQFARDLAAAAALLTLLWLSLDPIADAQWISDAALEKIGLYAVPLCVNLIFCFLLAACARRLHDLGASGAWALLLAVPAVNMVFVILLLALPGRPYPTGWPRGGGKTEKKE